MGEVVWGTDFRRGAPDPDCSALPQPFCDAFKAVRQELAALVPFAKSGGPIQDHNEYACSDSNPEPAA